MQLMSSENSEVEPIDVPPPPPEELPPPPPPEPEAPEPEPAAGKRKDAWEEDYEEHIKPEKPMKPRKRRHYGGIVIVVTIIVILVLWTFLSPKVMPQAGETYMSSQRYANLGSYIGYRDIWAGNMTWGFSISGPNTTHVGTVITISVLVTKVYEKPGNFFFRGSWISLKNVSIYSDNDTWLASMSNYTVGDFGPTASIPVSFDTTGEHDLYVRAKFLAYMDMRIGFMPLESVLSPAIYLDEPIVVSA